VQATRRCRNRGRDAIRFAYRSNKGLKTIDFLEIIIEQSKVPVIIDAGIGAPSDAAKAMELGADAVLVNTAIAVAGNRN
jgi:thiazole synthase